MAYPATKRVHMSVEEFLAWNPGDDLRYELVDGQPVAQSAPAEPHGRLVANITTLLSIDLQRRRKPCATVSGSALRIPPYSNVRVPDVHVLCGEDRRSAHQPLLAVEVLSPDNSASEMTRKRTEYASVGMVEMLEVEQDQPEVTLYQRRGDAWVVRTYQGLDARVELESLGSVLSLAEIYVGVFDEGSPDGDALST